MRRHTACFSKRRRTIATLVLMFSNLKPRRAQECLGPPIYVTCGALPPSPWAHNKGSWASNLNSALPRYSWTSQVGRSRLHVFRTAHTRHTMRQWARQGRPGSQSPLPCGGGGSACEERKRNCEHSHPDTACTLLLLPFLLKQRARSAHCFVMRDVSLVPHSIYPLAIAATGIHDQCNAATAAWKLANPTYYLLTSPII